MDFFNNVKTMGIVNLNDDSFYSGSRVTDIDTFRRKLDNMIRKGVSIIDIGAVSSRPGANMVGSEEEWSRLEPFIREISANYRGISFSIDTFRSSIVLMAYQEMGRFIVNDISAGEWDKAMLPVVGRLSLRYVAVHHRGTFETMHRDWHYDDIVKEVLGFFERFDQRAREEHIENWILDPGFGFSKSVEGNLKILQSLEEFKKFRKPILAGVSRKSFIYKSAGLTPEGCGSLSKEFERQAVAHGATILRSHIE